MERMPEPKSEALRAMYWRDEILQLMFWIKGEGFGDEADPGLLERFLGVDGLVGLGYLDRLVDEGLLRTTPSLRYELTAAGHEHGAKAFVDGFGNLDQPAYGECSASCWCNQCSDEASACASAR